MAVSPVTRLQHSHTSLAHSPAAAKSRALPSCTNSCSLLGRAESSSEPSLLMRSNPRSWFLPLFPPRANPQIQLGMLNILCAKLCTSRGSSDIPPRSCQIPGNKHSHPMLAGYRHELHFQEAKILHGYNMWRSKFSAAAFQSELRWAVTLRGQKSATG